MNLCRNCENTEGSPHIAGFCSRDCLIDYQWKERIQNRGDYTGAVIDGIFWAISHYPTPDDESPMYHIKFFDGIEKKIQHISCWGAVPLAYVRELPNNAKFVPIKEIPFDISETKSPKWNN